LPATNGASQMTKFVIAGLQRTGTTLIQTALDSHPAIRCLDELFLFTYGIPHIKRARGAGVDQSYRQYIAKSWGNFTMDIFARRKGVYRYLEDLFAIPDYQAIGFKLMLAQLRRFPMVMDYIREHNFSVVHVIRSNLLKTHVSRVRTRVTGIAHSEHKVAQVSFRLETGNLVRDLQRIAAENDKWKSLAEDLPYMMLTYESFVANREEYNNRLLEFLSIEDKQQLVSPHKKVTSNSLEDVIDNYDEVRDCLDGTKFEYCLYE